MYNYNSIAYYFDTNCLQNINSSLLYSNDFNSFGNITYGHINVKQLNYFENSINNSYKCLIDIDYELIMTIDNCLNENTSNIFYNNTLKPDAWFLDMFDGNKDRNYSYVNKVTNDVVIWILDTGINDQHVEFNKNQIINVDSTFTRINLNHPHGTGVACSSSGINYGSSKNFTIYNYPVCRVGSSCGSSTINDGLLAVLNYVKLNKNKRVVINMSFGSYNGNDPLNTALGQYYNGLFEELINNGAIIVVASGNANQDACTWFYSYSPHVISVGSIDNNFNKADFSNYGKCVDIWTFGSGIVTAYSITNNYELQFKIGTSFSAPLITGLVANLLYQNISLTKNDILDILSTNVNNFIVPKYICSNKNNSKCCSSKIKGTRLYKFCTSLTIDNCAKSCTVVNC